MKTGKVISIIVLILVYLILVLADLGANLFSLIPYVGSAFETVSELIIELISLVIIMIMAIFGITGNKKWTPPSLT